ncbi:MAG: phosphoenolpyruvate--protein phosphotransferase [Deltaproteobacteria bacterium]|jgi:phosphotransferase system enzyme I (PtsI)|nr:phosphoenolpyruvate--protein phosphotransferase [Deltaproteobacteria bacterium]
MILPPPFVPQDKVFKGIGLGSAVVSGTAFAIGRRIVPRYTLEDEREVEEEIKRLRKAFDRTEKELRTAQALLPKDIADSGQEIFDVYLALLKERRLTNRAVDLIRTGMLNAEAALSETAKSIKAMMRLQMGDSDPYISRRADDVEHLVDNVIGSLQGSGRLSLGLAYPNNSIIVASSMSPAEVAAIPRDRVVGLVTEDGSLTSHSALLAQALEIPAVMGVQGIHRGARTGDRLILDSAEGHVIVAPDTDTSRFYQTRAHSLATFQREIVRMAHIPALTLDDAKVEVCGNLELVEQLPAIMSYGAEGIGLYRTEMSYLTGKTLPSEDELFEIYSRVVSSTFPGTVTIRTLDLGADKMPQAIGSRLEGQSQALGLRAIRFCLKHQDIFRTQLRAILRASASGNLRIMLPMISTIEEILEAKRILYSVKEELNREGRTVAAVIPVGIMVEVPSAVVLIRELGAEADFFSIGTNDLIQYTLALDRTNPEVMDLYQPLHPAILRMIKVVIDAGREMGRPVSICGGMAAEPVGAALLVGLGANMLSMPFYNIPVIKRLVRMSFMGDMEALAGEVLGTTSSQEAERLTKLWLQERLPDLLT